MRRPVVPPDPLAAAQALRQYRRAHSLCAPGCRSYHAAWPWLRAGALVGGIDADRGGLSVLLKPFLQRPHLRVLIAGSADRGQLQLVAELAGQSAPQITVVDRCATPLTDGRDGWCQAGPEPRFWQGNLLDFTPETSFDLILCHSLLPFLDAADRSTLLSRFAHWLAPGGRVLLAAKFDPLGAQPLTTLEREQALQAKRQLAMATLTEAATAAGLAADALDADVQGFYRHMADHPTPFQSVADVVRCCELGGLSVDASVSGGLGLGYVAAPGTQAGLGSVLLWLRRSGEVV